VRGEDGQEKPQPPPGGASLRIHTSPRRDHMGNFLDSIRGEAQPHCNIDLGCATMVAIKMGVESYRTGKALLWDAEKQIATPA
jgi:hypothetical protein